MTKFSIYILFISREKRKSEAKDRKVCRYHSESQFDDNFQITNLKRRKEILQYVDLLK